MMNKNKIFVLILPLLCLGLVFTGCTPRARYERKLKQELASGERHDSIFMGIYLGMNSKDFYVHCWKLNSKGLIRQGESNTNVEYQLDSALKFPATMNFYPAFVNDKICEMPVRFKYRGWAPWNKALASDKLQEDVLAWYKIKYGNSFIKVKHPKWGMAYIQLHGNRRITVFREDDIHVWAYFTDMSVKNSPFNSDMIQRNIQHDTIE